MTVVDEVRAAVERTVPDFRDHEGDWAAVLASAQQRPLRPHRWAIAVVAAVVAAGTLALFWPTGGDGILERARAVIGNEPVVHVVLRGAPVRVYDLRRHEYRNLPQTREEWYDPELGAHLVRAIGSRVVEELFLPKQYSPTARFPDGTQPYAGVATAYRAALDAGRASLGATETVRGHRVHWIRFGVDFHWRAAQHEVAVDAETFEPRFVRIDRGPVATVAALETFPSGTGDFEPGPVALMGGLRPGHLGRAPGPDLWSGTPSTGPRTPDEARASLRGALWLGARFHDLPLASIREVVHPKREGAPPVGEHLVRGLELCYGSAQRCPVSLTLATHITATAFRSPAQPWPFDPEPGTLVLAERQPGVGYTIRDGAYLTPRLADARIDVEPVLPRPEPGVGFLVRDGIYVTLVARDRPELIAAAEALTPIP
jgi:hypothetical protein